MILFLFVFPNKIPFQLHLCQKNNTYMYTTITVGVHCTVSSIPYGRLRYGSWWMWSDCKWKRAHELYDARIFTDFIIIGSVEKKKKHFPRNNVICVYYLWNMTTNNECTLVRLLAHTLACSNNMHVCLPLNICRTFFSKIEFHYV